MTSQKQVDGIMSFTQSLYGFNAKNTSVVSNNEAYLSSLYQNNWIVGTAIDVVANDMTRAGITLTGELEPDQTKAIQTQMTRIGVWLKLAEALRYSRLYGGSVAAIVIDGQDPATPLRLETVSKGSFKGLRVYDRYGVNPSSNLVQYGINAGTPDSYTDVQNSKITWHHSRVVRMIGTPLPPRLAQSSQFWGDSVLSRILDRIDYFNQATEGAAQLVNKAHLRTISVEGLREVLAAGGKQEDNLKRSFQLLNEQQKLCGLTILDKRDAFATNSYSFTGLSDMMLQFAQQLSGGLRIPLTILLGQSPAGLNATGESDTRMYYDGVFSQQESSLRDGLTRILRVLHKSVLGIDPSDSFDFNFNPLWQTSQAEKAQIANLISTQVLNAYSAGVLDQASALRELKASSEITGVFGTITDDQIQEAEIEPPPVESTGLESFNG